VTSALIELRERSRAGHGALIFEDERLLFGFSQGDFPAAALKEFFPSQRLLFLKQIHSDRIVSQADWQAGIEADGLLLDADAPGAIAVIQTADCLPLFFFSRDRNLGGVIHVGWRGLWLGIEAKLVSMLGSHLESCFFYIGPGIEKKCYEVGEELPESFKGKPYAGSIFASRGGKKYAMDLKAGLTLSLRALGVKASKIQDCGLCTYCGRGRFPSYRRDGKTGKRIFNFLQLKSGYPSVK
jgi:YfiH family protein